MQSPGLPRRRRRRGGPGPAPGPPPAAGPGAPAGAGRGPRRCPEAPRLGKRGRGRLSFEGKTLSFSSENSAGFLRAPRDSPPPPPPGLPSLRPPQGPGHRAGERKGGPRAEGRALGRGGEGLWKYRHRTRNPRRNRSFATRWQWAVVSRIRHCAPLRTAAATATPRCPGPPGG